MSGSRFVFDRLFEEASDPAFVLDPLDDRFLAANAAACAMLGYTLKELLEMPVSRIHPGELPQLQEFVADVLGTGRGSTIKLTCRTRSGAYLPTDMSLAAFERDGRTYLVGLVRDRSEHRQRRRDD